MMTEEKRRYKRAGSALSIQYKNLRKINDPAGESLSRNISEGGVCFQTSKFISLACRLIVEISIPTSLKPIKAISKVAWIRKISSGDQYELGNQFLEISKEDKSIITDYVSRFSNTAL